MAAPKLNNHIRTELNKSDTKLEIPCGLGCGNLMREWMQVSVLNARTPKGEGEIVTFEKMYPDKPPTRAETFALDLRVCHQCFGIFVYDLTLAHKALLELAARRA